MNYVFKHVNLQTQKNINIALLAYIHSCTKQCGAHSDATYLKRKRNENGQD